MKPDFIALYPDKALVGSSKLNAAQFAVYWLIIFLIYSEGGPIERDDTDLARRLRVRRSSVSRALDELIAMGKLSVKCIESVSKMYRGRHENVVKLSCERCEYELTKARKRHEDGTNAAYERWKDKYLADAVASNGAYAQGNAPAHYNKTRLEENLPSLDSETPFRAIGDLATPPLATPARRKRASLAAATAFPEGTLYPPKFLPVPGHFEGCQCPACSRSRQ